MLHPPKPFLFRRRRQFAVDDQTGGRIPVVCVKAENCHSRGQRTEDSGQSPAGRRKRMTSITPTPAITRLSPSQTEIINGSGLFIIPPNIRRTSVHLATNA